MRHPRSPKRCRICGCGELAETDWNEHGDPEICRGNIVRRLIDLNAKLEKLKVKK
jgi:hypothetical protein